jgi:hypothetical protein
MATTEDIEALQLQLAELTAATSSFVQAYGTSNTNLWYVRRPNFPPTDR